VDPGVVTFVVAGCQRCGTTWLDAALREHPEIYLPSQKQTYYFDRHFERGDAWYLENYRDVQPTHKAVGEVATGYSLLDAIPRLAALLPHAKIIMAMRNPTERASSFYESRRGEQGWKSFAQARAEDPEILERGRYIEQIEALLEHYPRERLLPLFYDDLATDERAYFRSVLEFLSVDPDFETTRFGRRVNAAMFPQLRVKLKSVGLGPLVKAASRSPLGDFVRTRNKKKGGSGNKIDPAERRELIEYYRPFNARLAAFAGRDLSAWDRQVEN
jgi:Sulfotransferase domain